MKNRSLIRVLALLLALLLTGVFPVLAETYLEYSGGLSAADARTLLGVDRAAVTVSIQQLDFNGNILQSQSFTTDSDGALSDDAIAYINSFDSQYKWYNEAGTQITPATATFTANTTITTKPSAVTSGVSASFYIYLDGEWTQVGSTTTLYGKYNITGGERYLILASQLEAAFGAYGFDASTFPAHTQDGGPADYRFIYGRTNSDSVWADTNTLEYYGEKALALSGGISDYRIHYIPANASLINNKDRDNYTSGNDFFTLTLETNTGDTASYPLLTGANLSDWLTAHADVIPSGWTHPLSYYDWCKSDGTELGAADTISAATTLTGTHAYAALTLRDADGNELAKFTELELGANLSDWLTANDSLTLSNGKTVHDYTWKLPNDTAINDLTTIGTDTTIYGSEKPYYTVTFIADQETGGSFRDASESYTSVQVLEGDCVPSAFLSKMRANLVLQDTYAFVEWQYAGNEGYLPLTASTPISADTTVWADYTQQVYVRFWTGRDKATAFPNTGLENQPVDQKYEGNVPSEDAIAAAAPAEGMRFRYWMDANTGMVFTVETDRVESNLDLYPVYERAIFVFKDASGAELDTMYDGDPLDYEANAPAGYYYAGLQVTLDDGSTILIPNGTKISREYLTTNSVPMTGPVNGYYTITAEPIYKQQRTVIYHTGGDAKFILDKALGASTYTVAVNDQVQLLGALDITNTVSPIGLALDGWATTENAATAEFEPSALFEGETELDALVAPGETIHLYPVWAQKENTVAVTFVSNYPTDAVDENGNALTEEVSYTIYIKSGMKPTVPMLDLTGIATPANTLSDAGTKKYSFAGWSRDDDGQLTESGNNHTEEYGTYTEGSEYALAVTQNTTFYAIWVDASPVESGTEATFHIRLDGTIPFEPSQYTASSYLPGTCGTGAWTGVIKKQLNVVNHVADVEANIQEEPDIETIYNALKSSTSYVDAARFDDLTVDDYGTKWWIDWYACKYSCGYHYHVDGRVRFSDQVELNYHPNGGANVPPSSMHTKDTSADVNVTSHIPVRDGFYFIGWDEDPAAKVPDYPAEGYTFTGSLNADEIYMSTDKDLYAIWQPTKITIPMDEDFQGQKYEQTNDEEQTTPQEGRTYQFTIEAVSLPTGAEPYAKQTATSGSDGSFTFPHIDVAVEGLYVFEVREIVGSLPVQYDTSIYRLTINIVESEYGLGIAGYSFTKDNKIIPVTNNDVNKVVFEFTNRTDVRSVTVTKKWEDNENQDNLRPSSVRLTLLREGDQIFEEPIDLSSANGWTYTWENLDIKDTNGALYEYYVSEETVAEYETTYSGDMNSGLIVTNTHIPRTVSFPVVKVWSDGDNAEGYRPDTLTYTLTGAMPNGTVIQTVSSGEVASPWSHTFTDMPVYHLGQPLSYTLTEADIPGYTASIRSSASGDGGMIFTVTNTLQATHATVAKQVTGNAGSLDAAFPFTAKVYDASGQLLTDLPAGTGYTVDADGTLRFSLAHDGQVRLDMLPIGGSILLSEEAEGYEISWSDGGTEETGGMRYAIAEGGLAITVTNNREVDIPTGVALDYVPSLLLMGLALLGLAGLQKRRRRV